MTETRIRTVVALDGSVTVPVGPDEVGREVDVTLVPSPPRMTQAEWEAFVDRTAGSIPDLVRPPQGQLEVRLSLD